MYAVNETSVDESGTESVTQHVYHHPDLTYINKAKKSFEQIELEGTSYEVEIIQPTQDFDCPVCGEGLEMDGPKTPFQKFLQNAVIDDLLVVVIK